MSFEIGLRLKHVPLIALHSPKSEDERLGLLAYFQQQLEEIRKKEFQQSQHSAQVTFTELDDLITSMEPVFLHAHLDSGFLNKNRITLINIHQVDPEPLDQLTLSNTLPIIKLHGSLPKSTKALPINSRICFQSMNQMITKFGAFGMEDAGCSSVNIYTLLNDLVIRGLKLDGTPFPNPVCNQINLISKGGGIFETKGILFLEVHSLKLSGGLVLEEYFDISVPERKEFESLSFLSKKYLSRHEIEKDFFVPISKGTTSINAPLLPGNISINVESNIMIPLPGYMIFDSLNYNADFVVNLFYIMVDRDWHMFKDNTKKEKPKTRVTHSFHKMMSFLNFYLAKIKSSLNPKESTHFRASFMAKFVVMYIQSINYNSDKATVTNTKNSQPKKTMVEQFSDPLSFLTLDCEDGTKGIQMFHKTLIEKKPHIMILKDLNIRAGWDSVITLLKKSSNSLDQLLLNFLKEIVDADVKNDFSPLFTNLLNILPAINTQDVSSSSNPDLVASIFKRLTISLLLFDFHSIACYYIDMFHLFGVKVGNSQNDISKHLKGDKDKIYSLHDEYITNIDFTNFKPKFEDVYQIIKDAHAACILWPYPYFKAAVKKFYDNSPLATDEIYLNFIKKYKTGPFIFGEIDEEDLPQLLCEGTGMVQPGSYTDPIRVLRKYVYSFPLFQKSKKKLLFPYIENHIYQNINLALTPRFLKEYGICSFMVSSEVKMDAKVNKSDTIQMAMTQYLQDQSKALSEFNESNQEHPNYYVSDPVFDFVKIEGSESIKRKYRPFLKMEKKVPMGKPLKIKDDVSTLEYDKSQPNSLNGNIETSKVLLTRGLPFRTVMTKNPDVMLVPFGFGSIDMTKKTNSSKIDTNEFNKEEIELLEIVMKQRPYIPSVAAWSTKNKKNIINLSEFYNITKPLIINEEPEENTKFTAVIKNGEIPVLQRNYSEKMNISDLTTIPTEKPLSSTKFSHLRLFEEQFHGKHLRKNMLKLSIFLAPEQLPNEATVRKTIFELKNFFPDNFIMDVGVVIEHLSCDLCKIRLDLFVNQSISF